MDRNKKTRPSPASGSLTGAAHAGEPSLNLSPDEKRLYGQLFRQADTENVGIIMGEVAVKFFEKTRLDSKVLGEVSLLLSRPRSSPGSSSTCWSAGSLGPCASLDKLVTQCEGER